MYGKRRSLSLTDDSSSTRSLLDGLSSALYKMTRKLGYRRLLRVRMFLVDEVRWNRNTATSRLAHPH